MKVVFLIFILFGNVKLIKSKRCIKHCEFFDQFKLARCSSLHYIPTLPSSVRTIFLENNVLPFINKETFHNVSSNKLRRLIFINNSMETITEDAFSSLKYLRRLEIYREKRLNNTLLKSSFRSLNNKIVKEIKMESNDWRYIPTGMFDYLSGPTLFLISLSYNKLTQLDGGLFKSLVGLKLLFCEGNAISEINVEGFFSVENLDLSDNNVFAVPNFCDVTGKSLTPSLRKLSLSDNAIRNITKDSFKCLKKLVYLSLDANRIRILGPNVFSLLSSLKTISVNRMSQLETITGTAFNSSSLEALMFTHNRYNFDRKVRKYNPYEIFRYLPNLTNLDLSYNYLPRREHIFRAMFLTLNRLQVLNISYANFSIVPKGLLQSMPGLKILNVHGNNIEQWNPSLFENMSSLRELRLAGNKINLINTTSFSDNVLESLNLLDLSNNPFWCVCDQKWFLDTLRMTNLTLKMPNWPKEYRCNYPETMKRSMIITYFPTAEECTELNIASIIIITITSAIFMIFWTVVVMFRCQANIKNAIYLIRVYRQRKQGYLMLESSKDFEFDVFIVYCDADREWVHSVLLKTLETKGFKVCIHHRDFDVGEHITNNIENFMEKSWKIVVVMSNALTKSEWCQWEIDLVQERRRKQGRESLVLIMFRQIDSHHMTSPLRTLLDTTPYLVYQEGFGEQFFWKTVIKSVNKSLGYPPTSVL